MSNPFAGHVDTASTANFASAVSTVAQILYTAVSGKSHSLFGLGCSYSTTPTVSGAQLKVECPSGQTMRAYFVTEGGPAPLPYNRPLVAPLSTDMLITLDSGGSGIIGTVFADKITR